MRKMLKPGGYFFPGSIVRYDKPALSIAKQVERLKERGLLFPDADEKKVRHYLTHIGYYRLSAYWLPFEEPLPPQTDQQTGKRRAHRFRPGTTFDQVLSLYIFDRQLRLLVMEAFERIEIAVRTAWAHTLATKHKNPHAHLDATLFKCPWKHASDIASMAKQLQGSKETFVVHYRERYKNPFLPPIWAVVETMSLGSLSSWVAATKDNSVKREIAQKLELPTVEVLESVLHALTPVRNICAHHGRLWNRRLTLQLPRIKRLRKQMVFDQIAAPKPGNTTDPHSQSDQSVPASGTKTQQQPAREIYNYLFVIAHLIRSISPGSSWPRRLSEHIQDHIQQHPDHQKAMGFPDDWEHRPIWQDQATPGPDRGQEPLA
ncbi:MAG: Abi family protein [Lautropia sp.]|nr:Abi family protein [Lautropia sp.]